MHINLTKKLNGSVSMIWDGRVYIPSKICNNMDIFASMELPNRIYEESGERSVVFNALVGSRNLKLNDEHSDWDMVSYVIPSFNDLYKGNRLSKTYSFKPDMNVEGSIYDIRSLPEQLYKSNLNRLETLYSTKWWADAGSPHDVFSSLLKDRELFARIDTKRLYDSLFGFFFSEMKHVADGTATTADLVKRYGYDTKRAMHAYRLLTIIKDYADNDFQDFEKCVMCKDHLDTLRDIRFGNAYYSYERFKTDIGFLNGDATLRKRKYDEYVQPAEERERIEYHFKQIEYLVRDEVSAELECSCD